MIKSENTIFVGRKEVLQDLINFARSAFSGKAGVALVTGEAGVGKTLLVEELFHRLRKEYDNLVVAAGRCKRESTSYSPFRSILENLLGSIGINTTGAGDIVDEKQKTINAVVMDVVQEIGPHVVEIFFPLATAAKIREKFLEKQKELSGIALSRSLEQVQIFGWYTRIMKAISQSFPLALFIDDLHLADISSLDLLLHLGREIENEQVLVIGAYSPHETPPESLLIQIKCALEHLLPVGTHRPHEARPDPFLVQLKTELERYGAQNFSLDVSQERPETVEKITRFVYDYLIAKYGTNFSERFEECLVEMSEGNPLFLTEALIDFEEKGQLRKGFAKKAASESDSDTIHEQGWKLPTELEYFKNFPETIEDLISRRVNRLDEGSREMLEYASAQGEDLIIEAIPNVKPEQLDELSQNLKSHRFIMEKGEQLLPNGDSIHTWTFHHNLIRKYIYTQIPPEKRRQIHMEIGRCLERLYKKNTSEIVPELAVHFYHGHMATRAVHYCLKASEEANRWYGTPEAVRFGLMGLKTLEEQPEAFSQKAFAENRWRLLLELAKAEEAGGDKHPEEDHIRTGIAYLDDNLPILDVARDELHAEVHALLGKLYIRQGTDMLAAKENLERALYIYEQQENKRNVAEVLYQLARIVPAEESIEALEKCVSIAEELQDVDFQIRCLHSLTEKYANEDFSFAEKCAQQALQRSIDLGKSGNYLKIKALNVMASMCRENGKFQTGICYLEESLELARRMGDILLEASILNDLGFDYGRFVTLQEKARETLKESIVVRERAGFDKSAPLYNLGWIFTRQGQWKEAEECFQKALIESDETSQATYRGDIGCLYELQENYAQAEMELLYRLEVLEQQQRSHNLFGYTGIAQNYALSGNEAQSRHYLEAAYTLFEEEPRPRRKWWCLYEIADGYRMLKEYDTAKTACQKSMEWFLNTAENAEDLIYLAGAHLVMGKILVETEEHQEALSYLNKAKTAFETCQHYALGEAWFYLGKAYQGIGDHQAREYINRALAEFQRLKLQHKALKAQELLEEITG